MLRINCILPDNGNHRMALVPFCSSMEQWLDISLLLIIDTIMNSCNLVGVLCSGYATFTRLLEVEPTEHLKLIIQCFTCSRPVYPTCWTFELLKIYGLQPPSSHQIFA